jgi:hypothetical protein
MLSESESGADRTESASSREPPTQPRIAVSVQPSATAAAAVGRRGVDRTGDGSGEEPATRPRPAERVQPPAAAPVLADAVGHEQIFRYGQGVPVRDDGGAVPASAARAWRTGRLPQQQRRWSNLRRRLGSALTVVLLAASGVVLYLRFHHAAFHVTGVTISQQTRTRCRVNVTGRIGTNGSAGTVNYQWLFIPGRLAPQPLSQSVIAGQRAVYVTITVAGGIGQHGRASRRLILQVLGPDLMSASTTVSLSCR